MNKIFWALDSKQPVLNGRGKDIRRIYKIVHLIGGVEHTMEIVASCIADAYHVYDSVMSEPAPEIISICSVEFRNVQVSDTTEA
jgi:hypothetical protein